MREMGAAILGAAALVLVVWMGLTLVKWAREPSGLTKSSRKRVAISGLRLLALGLAGCVFAFLIAMVQLGERS